MAAGTKLVCVFADADGNNITMSYNYADPEVSTSSVQAFCQGVITNGSIFDKIPLRIKSAKVVSTSERVIETV